MKKALLFSCALLFGLSLVLVGCGGDDPAPAPTGNGSTAGAGSTSGDAPPAAAEVTFACEKCKAEKNALATAPPT